MKLTAEQHAHYEQHGYVVVSGGLEASDIEPVIRDYNAFIDAEARRLHDAGSLTNTFADEPFDRRLARICEEDASIYGQIDLMHCRLRGVFDFLRNERLLDLVEGIVGPEITCSPIQHTRAKLPAEVTPEGSDPHVAPWHQDSGVTWDEADPHFILTIWLPLTPARPENGCLQIIPRAHGGGMRQHHIKHGLGTVILDDEMPEQEPLTLPMDKGDVLLMHKQTPHRSTANNADVVRWSMDLRYQRTGTPTGRPYNPDFVARSRSNPSSEFRDYDEWCRLWVEALKEIKGKAIKGHRWAVVK